MSTTTYGYRYDPAGSRCTGGPAPGAIALRDAVLDRFDRLTNLGIYNCRPVRGGTSLSLHAEGRAIDVGADPADPAAQAQGHWLAELLRQRSDRLGVQEVIWHRRRWTSTRRTWVAYGGANPHIDHVHVSLCWPAARGLTEAAAGAALDDAPPPPPPPPSTSTSTQEWNVPTLDLRHAHSRPVRTPLGAIRKLQGLLLAHGYPSAGLVGAGCIPDGVAGSTTARLVERFQTDHQLTADRIVGPRTWRALIET